MTPPVHPAIIAIVRSEYAKGTHAADVGLLIGRAENTVRKIARNAGIVHPTRPRCYTAEDDAFILASKETLGYAGVAKALNRSRASIETRFRDLCRREAGITAKPAPKPAPVEVDPDAPFRSKSGIVAKRNRIGVSLPYIASLGG